MLDALPDYATWHALRRGDAIPKTLYQWYTNRAGTSAGYDLLDKLLQYGPARRCTAAQALQHPWFAEEPLPTAKYVQDADAVRLRRLRTRRRRTPPARWW